MAEPQAATPRGTNRGLRGRAVLLKRFDFRETSRVITLATREHGLVNALAKGAHRPDSPFLGRLDFLNELTVQLSADRGSLRLLLRADLLVERRALRRPERYVAASHLASICHPAFESENGDPLLFDLLTGGLTLIERCPIAALPVVVLGLEMRLLAHLGALPDLDRCGDCSRALGLEAFAGETAGSLVCQTHASAPRRAIGGDALQFLRTLRDSPGRTWPEVTTRPSPIAIALPQNWLLTSLEARSKLRRRIFSEQP